MRGGQAAGLAQALAEAFRDNPLNCAVLGRDPPGRLRANRVGMELTLLSAAHRATVWVATSVSDSQRVAGGLIALPPGGWPLPPPSVMHQFLGLVRQGIRATHRWGRVYSELADLHPTEPHWYLSTLGIRPAQQRQGLASALLDGWLEQVDRAREAAYLETDHSESLAFYLKRGFHVIEERVLFEVPIWRMWRPAKDPRSDRG